MKNNKLVRSYVVICLCLSLVACVPDNRDSSASSVKFQQYFVEGEGLYKTYCVNCHQSDGTGLRRLYPPLDRSDFMQNNLNEVICLIKNGREGELWVNGVMYNQPMKGIPSLTELEVAELATYIYNAWNNQRGLVGLGEASSALSSCPDK